MEVGTQVTPQVSFPDDFWSPINLLRQMMQAILTALGLMALGVLVVLLLPNQMAQVTQVLESAPAASLGVGLLSLVVIPILAVLLIITCIGPFILVLAALVAGLFGWLAVGLFVGNKILHGSAHQRDLGAGGGRCSASPSLRWSPRFPASAGSLACWWRRWGWAR